MPGSLKSVSRKLIDQFHSFPLAFIGVGKPGAWDRLVILRPKLVKGRSQAITLSRLVVDPVAPTTHDLSVISGLQWDSTKSDTENHQAIDNALDVERVTRQFFRELNSHYQAIVQGVEKLAKEDPSIYSGVDAAGGHERVALRIITQTLFCYFLQKKGLLEKNPKWLSVQFDNWTKSGEEGSFYADVMESLFYGMLNTPVDERDSSLAGRQVPFLNGGLFERRYGGISIELPNELFNTDDGLLGFLDGWNFTVSEERADETEVAVDPEMLGKVFENLMADHDKKSQGAVYTPRPVVQFMCREALVPYLQRKADIPENQARILIDGDDPFVELAEATTVEHSAEVADAVEEAMTTIQV
ncbi:MAG TPA: hypothetical protein PLE93_11270, partial [Solirubrobacterales bacterium]|nr:hypothetical protein [Solirubrobacterales bacterium]